MSGVRHPIFARCYAWLSTRMEAEIGPLRRRQLAPLRGNVIELGAGNGMNFGHYRPAVTRVVAVEPEPHLRRLARYSAARAPVPVQVVAGLADRLPAADASVDAAVTTLVLCSVPDAAAAVAELRQVLRPGGQLRFLEHVRADTTGLRRVQRLLDATVWPLVAGGCHTCRDTAATIRAAGLEITEMDALAFPDIPVPVPSSPHILGTAVRR
jgi:SAM-dependent methyltransferase